MEYEISLDIPDKNIATSTLKLGGTSRLGERISFTNYYMERNGEPYFGICGEFHYSRYPEKNWETELRKMKSSGIGIVATYIFWNHHEEKEGELSWEGNLDLRRFVALSGKVGLKVILRPGPFCHGEVRNGGLPDWLFGRAFDIRSNDDEYLAYVRAWYGVIAEQVKDHLFKDGGPVIGVQLENEFMHAAAIWELTAKQGDEYFTAGTGGEEHMRRLKRMAIEAGLQVPIYTSTGWGGATVLEDEVLPLYGGYAYTPWSVNKERPRQKPTGEYLFVDYHNDHADTPAFDPPYVKTKYPFACCEMGGGMQAWYLSRFIIDPESVMAMSLMKIAGGCNFIGYYMFHGGTNPVGRTAYMNESTTPKITYDFQAPIGEFGQVRASNDLLRPLHYFLRSFGKRLAPMATVLPEGVDGMAPEQIETLRYAARVQGGSGFLFINNYQDHVEMRTHTDVTFTVELQGQTLSFPRHGGLTVEKGVAAMLPLGFDLDGALLTYATVQLITKLDAAESGLPGEDRSAFLAYMPRGMEGELCFEQYGIDEITVTGGELDRSDQHYYVRVSSGRSAVIRLQLEGNRERLIYVMTSEEAGKLWEVELHGRRRMFLSEAAVISDDEGLHVLSYGRERVELKAFMPWSDEEGLWSSFVIQAPRRDIPLDTRRLHEHKVAIQLGLNALDDLEDVLLHIEYDGNVGYAFANGRLFHDHFWNGRTWEIGLARFRTQLEGKELIVQTTPRRDNGIQAAVIQSVTAIPVYRIRVDHL